MSVSQLDLDALPHIDGGIVVILVSKWHKELVDSMELHCRRVLKDHGIRDIETVTVPGTLEMPLAALWHTRYSLEDPDALICLSVVEKGDTAHFDMIIQSTTQTLMNLSMASEIPIINEILAVYKHEDAVARASDDEHNKGLEAAAAALEMIAISREMF